MTQLVMHLLLKHQVLPDFRSAPTGKAGLGTSSPAGDTRADHFACFHERTYLKKLKKNET